MIIGIDIGGSTTDAVLVEDDIRVVTIEANDPYAAAAGALGKLVANLPGSLRDVRRIAATGAGAAALGGELLGVPVTPVSEIDAIGRGGTTLAGLDEALVVSMGTGTAMVCVRNGEIRHVGGTGVGGGTLLGLSKHLLNATRLETIEALAARGDLKRVDVDGAVAAEGVGDIAGGPVGNLPVEATASNFGQLRSDATVEDKARALVNMIAEVIVSLSITAARGHGVRRIVLTGKLLRVTPVVERIRATRRMFDLEFLIPAHAEYATAIGAARSLQ